MMTLVLLLCYCYYFDPRKLKKQQIESVSNIITYCWATVKPARLKIINEHIHHLSLMKVSILENVSSLCLSKDESSPEEKQSRSRTVLLGKLQDLIISFEHMHF